MTTPGPEPDPRWDVQAAVPGWSLGQDFYTGPIYDDTGWHLDLSDVDWGQNAKANPRAGTAPAPPATFRYERNVVTPAPAGYERSPGPPAPRPAGRHARHARPAEPRYPEAQLRRTGAAPPPPPERRAETGSFSIVRSSSVMAVGTLASRLTGFLRTIVQNAAFGVAGVAAAYNLSNTLPNVVYNLALGGILTSVIVPLIVNASKRDSDRGQGYDQRMFTLVTAALLAITVVAMLAAVPIVHLYAGSSITDSAATIHLAVIFALFFIPQIFFYGVSSLIGAILNSRGSFAAPMWTPIVNNFVVIAVLALYVVVAGKGRGHAATITGSQVWLLGLGTTLGIIAQTIALVPALRRVGFRWHPRADFQRGEVSEIGRMAGWMFGYIVATQVAFLITTRVAGDASLAGLSEYNYAWLLFQLPYAVVGISVITALLPRMSSHAADGRLGLVRTDFSTGVRLAAGIVVPCSLVLAVLGPKFGVVFFAHGKTTSAAADYMGVIFALFCLGLLPYMIFQLQLRVFYSLHDSKTPALIGLVTMSVNIAANLIALSYVTKPHLVAALGVGFGLANLCGAVVAWRILAVRLRGLDGWRIGRSLVRMHAATIPAALIAIVVESVTGNAYVDVIIGGGLAFAMYLIFARVLRIEELNGLTRMLLARVGR
jgi:putative peptidoglycan lipid II flippase